MALLQNNPENIDFSGRLHYTSNMELLEKSMTSLTIKNLPEVVYKTLKHHAKVNHRSMNSEIIWRLQNSVLSTQIDHEEMLAQAEKLRQFTASHPLTDDELFSAKSKGRP